MNALDASSTRPYLIRALYEWCTDNGLTPYVAVSVDATVQVPREYVKNNEIVLNISFDATSSLKLGNEFIEFKARFAGSSREIQVPISHVIAIYARENGQGMAFPMGSPVSAPEPIAEVEVEVEDDGIAASAATGAAEVHESKIMQLVPETERNPSPDADDGGPDFPEPPKSSPRTRPSLTRVK